MKQKILGIDIGSYSIKVAEIERSFRSFELVGFYEQPILKVESGSGETQALQRLFEEYDIESDFLYTALPGDLTSFRTVELPFSNFKKVDTTIEFEMENYLPLPLEEVVVDYEIVESKKTFAKVMTAFARKGELIKFMNHFAGAELDPRFVGAEPVELANLLKLGIETPEETYAIIDLGHKKTNVCLFSGKSLQLARTIMIGGRDFTKAIANALKIPENEAEKIKIEMGQVGEAAKAADAMTRQVSDAISTPLQELIVQVKQTLLSFQEEKGEVVQALLLTGGSSRLVGVDQFISKGLRKNVSFLECMDFPSNNLADTSWCRSIAASALSLAYRGVQGAGNRDLHFRRGEFAYKGEVKHLTSLVKEVGIQIGVISLFVVMTFLVSFASLSGKVSEQRDRVAEIASEVLKEIPKKSLSNSKNVISILNGRMGEVEEKKRRLQEETSLLILTVLKEVSSLVPSKDKVKLDIDNLTITSGRVRLTGRTDSFEAVDQIKNALSVSKEFQNVATQNVRKGIRDEVKFDIELEMKQEGEDSGS